MRPKPALSTTGMLTTGNAFETQRGVQTFKLKDEKKSIGKILVLYFDEEDELISNHYLVTG
jgi:hypothetical protein